jgi:ubiquinone/menaquinone biosynthesis C-methylase UbiE
MKEKDEPEQAGILSPQSAYDEWAEHYDEEDPSTLLDQPFLLSAIQPFEGCRILDLGCGTGRYLRLVGSGSYAIGIDVSRKMLARARRQTPATFAAKWVQGSVEGLPFRAGSFDRLVSGLAWITSTISGGFSMALPERSNQAVVPSSRRCIRTCNA